MDDAQVKIAFDIPQKSKDSRETGKSFPGQQVVELVRKCEVDIERVPLLLVMFP